MDSNKIITEWKRSVSVQCTHRLMKKKVLASSVNLGLCLHDEMIVFWVC